MFDPFGEGKREEKVEMPTFGSFETKTAPSKAAFDPFGTEKPKDDTAMPTFGSFSTAKKETFDPFGTEKSKDDDNQMPTFGSFGPSKPIEKPVSEGEAVGPSKESEKPVLKEAFDPFGTEQARQEDTSMPTFGSFAPAGRDQPKPAASGSLSENSETNLKFGAFEGGADEKMPKVANEQKMPKIETQQNEPKRPQNERVSLSDSLSSVKTLLKPMPGEPLVLNFDPKSAQIEIPAPKKFSETSLARELADFCKQALNHTYVFQD